MERHWNVLKFTCGLMVDSSVLIETICQAFVEIVTTPKPIQSLCQLYGCLYLKDLHREKSPISRSPFNNVHLCYNTCRQVAAFFAGNRNYELYYFNGWDKGESPDEKWVQLSESKRTNQVKLLKPCSVVIHQGLFTSMDIYLLRMNWFIKQPIKKLFIFGEIPRPLDCNDVFVPQGIPLNTLAESTHSLRVKNISAEPYEPGFVIRNQSESATGHLERRRHCVNRPVGMVRLDYLHVAVFHKLDCWHILGESLCHCTMLTHLTYIRCRDPRFDTLGNNKELRELTVESCSLGLSTEADLYAQLRYLNQLEQISFKGMKCEKQLTRITRAGTFPNLTSLKRLSLQDCMLTTPTAITLMKSLVPCPLVEINLSDNFLLGFFKELHQTPDVTFKHLESMNCNNCDLLKTDTMALAGLVSENRLPVIKTIFMKGNKLANDRAVLDDFKKSCKLYWRRKGHPLQVYMDKSKDIRKRSSRNKVYEVTHNEKKERKKDTDEKDQMKDSNKTDEVHSSKEENETKRGNFCHIM